MSIVRNEVLEKKQSDRASWCTAVEHHGLVVDAPLIRNVSKLHYMAQKGHECVSKILHYKARSRIGDPNICCMNT